MERDEGRSMVAFGAALLGAGLASVVWALLTTKWTSGGWAALAAIATTGQTLGVFAGLIYAKGQVDQNRAAHAATLAAELRYQRNAIAQTVLAKIRAEVKMQVVHLERLWVVAVEWWDETGGLDPRTMEHLMGAASAGSPLVGWVLDEGVRHARRLNDAELEAQLTEFGTSWLKAIEIVRDNVDWWIGVRPPPRLRYPNHLDLSPGLEKVIDHLDGLWTVPEVEPTVSRS